MEKKKIKILFVPSDLAGVGHFRCIWPAQQMNKDFGGDFDIEITHLPNYDDFEYFAKFDIIHFHRELGSFENMPNFFKKLKERGVKLIVDIDDYWMPPTTHPLYYMITKHKVDERILGFVKNSDYVTTTTNIFAKEILKHNKNVFVVPNALDENHQMWNGTDAKQTEKVRISWIGGSSHMRDLELIRDDMNRLNSDVDLKGKYQIVLCGFDTRGTVTQVAPDGREHTRKILPHETIWNKFEEVFTTNYSICDDEYKKYLAKYTKDSYKNTPVSDLNYLRRWTLPLTQYGKHYDYCDICLAPLEENKFNEVKSELKVIESGFKKKVLIAQDFGAYSETVENGKNGILIPTKDNNKGWYKAMKKLILDKEYRDELSNNLNKFVLENYTLKIVTQKRVEFYKSILEKKSNEIFEECLEK